MKRRIRRHKGKAIASIDKFHCTVERLEGRCLLAADAIAVDTFVDSLDVDPGDGFAINGSDQTSLCAAIQESNRSQAAQFIVLPAGEHRLALAGTGEDFAARGDLDILGNLTIRGQGMGQTVISANHIDRIFEIHPGASLTLEDLTLTEGDTDGYGGAVLNSGNLQLVNVEVVSNQALDGGGIFNDLGGIARLVDSNVSINTATGNKGGGIYNAGVLQVTGGSVSGNRLPYSVIGGGGISNDLHGLTQLHNVGVSNNYSANYGGGIMTHAFGVLHVENIDVSGNIAIRSGGGIFSNGTVSILGSSISDNHSTSSTYGSGGGITVNTGHPVVTRSSIHSNTAAAGSPDVAGLFESQGGNVIGVGTGSNFVDGHNGDRVGTTIVDVGGRSPFVGNWENQGDGGVQRIEITRTSDEYQIAAWGQCHPSDCDWGSVELHVLGDSVEDTAERYAFASWDHGFKETHVTLTPTNEGLVLEFFNVFHDGSQRSDYERRYLLNLTEEIVPLAHRNTEQIQNVLSGRWVNTDSETRGITVLDASRTNNSVAVTAWGSCAPTDCNWGRTDVAFIGENITDQAAQSAIAKWDFGFSTTFLIFRFDGSQLAAESFTIFHDGSDRSHYRSLYVFQQQGAPGVANPDALFLVEDSELFFAEDLLLRNDTGLTSTTITSFSQPSNGSLRRDKSGALVYVPRADFSGRDSFTYRVADGIEATVNIFVEGRNDSPKALDDFVSTAEDSTLTISVSDLVANDSDVDGDTVDITALIQPSHGAVIDNLDGTLSYIPDSDFFGSDTFYYTIDDGRDGTATAAVTVVIESANDDPVARADTLLTDEDTSLTITWADLLGNDSDADGDELMITFVEAPSSGMIADNGDQTYSYIPLANHFGNDAFQYQIEDGVGGTATGVVEVTIKSVNDSPITNDESYVVAEDATIVFTLDDLLRNDFDDERDQLTIDTVEAPSHGLVVPREFGRFAYAPRAHFHGTDAFNYTVRDSYGATSIATVQFTVIGVNDSPVAVGEEFYVTEDTAIALSYEELLANDSDVDDDSLRVDFVGQPDHGAITDNDDGTLTYVPTSNFNGKDTFSYTIADGRGGYATATTTLWVTATNDAPISADDSFSAQEEMYLAIDISSMLENDLDIDGDNLQFESYEDPAFGVLRQVDQGTLGYMPYTNFSGQDRFQYTVSDGVGGRAVGTVVLFVSDQNDAPVAGPDRFSLQEDSWLTIDTSVLLENDRDLDDHSLQIDSWSRPNHGVLEDGGHGMLVYTPDRNYFGEDSFRYTVSDGHGGIDTVLVSLTVLQVNDEPVAADDSFSTAEDLTYTLATAELLRNDSDGDSHTLSLHSFIQPANGTLIDNLDGTLTYVPTPDFHGRDYAYYEIRDGEGGADTGSISIFVVGVNDSPIAVRDTLSTIEDVEFTFDESVLLKNDRDDDGDVLHLDSLGQPAHGSLTQNNDGTLTYQPPLNFFGQDDLHYTVSDGNGGFHTTTVSIHVSERNDDPLSVDDRFSTDEDKALAIEPSDLIKNDTDIDGDVLKLASYGQPLHGTLTGDLDGTWTYMPWANFYGQDQFHYTIDDGRGGYSTSVVNLVVSKVNDVPVDINDRFATPSAAGDQQEPDRPVIRNLDVGVASGVLMPSHVDEAFSEERWNPTPVATQVDRIIADNDQDGLYEVGTRKEDFAESMDLSPKLPDTLFTMLADGDLNGDGFADLLVLDGSNNRVQVHINDRQGGFEQVDSLQTEASPSSVTVGDVNADGLADIVVTNFESHSVSVFSNQGDTTFAADVYHTGPTPSYSALGDFDGDGSADIAVGSFTDGAVTVHYNDGRGAFHAGKTEHVGGSISFLETLTNNNGWDGLILSDYRHGFVAIIHGDENGLFANANYVDVGLGPVSTARLNGPRGSELAVSTDSSIVFIQGTSNPTVTRSVFVAVGSNVLLPFDINQDGLMDLAVANRNTGLLAFLLQNADGSFRAQPARGDSYNGLVALMDVNNDGHVDIISVEPSGIGSSVTVEFGDDLLSLAVSPSLDDATGTNQLKSQPKVADGSVDLSDHRVHHDAWPHDVKPSASLTAFRAAQAQRKPAVSLPFRPRSHSVSRTVIPVDESSQPAEASIRVTELDSVAHDAPIKTNHKSEGKQRYAAAALLLLVPRPRRKGEDQLAVAAHDKRKSKTRSTTGAISADRPTDQETVVAQVTASRLDSDLILVEISENDSTESNIGALPYLFLLIPARRKKKKKRKPRETRGEARTPMPEVPILAKLTAANVVHQVSQVVIKGLTHGVVLTNAQGELFEGEPCILQPHELVGLCVASLSDQEFDFVLEVSVEYKQLKRRPLQYLEDVQCDLCWQDEDAADEADDEALSDDDLARIRDTVRLLMLRDN